jgi:hypothetical protein
LSVFEHARDHLDHYRTLAGGRGGTVALAKILEMVTDLVREELAGMGSGRSTDAASWNDNPRCSQSTRQIIGEQCASDH